jgi:hypothetical protein
MVRYSVLTSNVKRNHIITIFVDMELKKKDNRGGKRVGAGHPFKYGERTINITFRIPTSHKELIKVMVKEYLDKVSAEHKTIKPTKSEHYGC